MPGAAHPIAFWWWMTSRPCASSTPEYCLMPATMWTPSKMGLSPGTLFELAGLKSSPVKTD